MPGNELFGDLALELAKEDGGPQGVAQAVDFAQKFAEGQIPDNAEFRKALGLWGIEVLGEGQGITKLVGREPTMRVKLPEGWVAKRHGGGGHNGLFDDQGRQRLWWHIHGWEPISYRTNARYIIRETDVGPKHAVAQVLDGGTPVHAVPFEYPTSRDDIRTYGDDVPTRYYLDWDALPEDQRESLNRANNAANHEAKNAARAWLDENRPGWRDTAKSWLVEGP